jgi:hypothetical protein
MAFLTLQENLTSQEKSLELQVREILGVNVAYIKEAM